jgi:hypothetical protein
MWRHDIRRKAATEEKLSPPLELAWTFRSRQAAQESMDASRVLSEEINRKSVR